MTDTHAVSSDAKVVLVTKEGLQKMQDELDQLRNVRRKEVAERIKEAISYGDLSENAEWEEAKNEQAFVEGRILELENKMKHAQIIVEQHGKAKGALVQVGSKVTVRNLRDKQEEVFAIVGSMEADPFEGKISNESPIGQALLDRAVGDTVKAVVPAGTVEYQVMHIV